MTLKKDYSEKFIKKTVIEIQIQHWGDNRQLSMKGIELENFTTIDNMISNESRSEFHSYIIK